MFKTIHQIQKSAIPFFVAPYSTPYYNFDTFCYKYQISYYFSFFVIIFD